MTRLYAPDFCRAADMAYLIGMNLTEFKQAVRNNFLPKPTKNPFTGVEIWDREEVVATLRTQRSDNRKVSADILSAARGA